MIFQLQDITFLCLLFLSGLLILTFRSYLYLLSTADGKVLATAAGRMKLFSCSDYKNIQKFSGHPVCDVQLPPIF